VPNVPEAYKHTPLADLYYGLDQPLNSSNPQEIWVRESWKCPASGDMETGFKEGWRSYNTHNLRAASDHAPLKFVNRQGYSLALLRRVSAQMMLASLIELYGPDPLSDEQIDPYKQTWSYSLVHQSNGARLEFSDNKGLPGLDFVGSSEYIDDALSLLTLLTQRQVSTPSNEADYRQTISDNFRLRREDALVLKDYDLSWDGHIDSESADELRDPPCDRWTALDRPPQEMEANIAEDRDAETIPHNLILDQRMTHARLHRGTMGIVKSAAWDPEMEEVAFQTGTDEELEPNHNLNCQISPPLLLVRLIAVFGTSIFASPGLAWVVMLSDRRDGCLCISNSSHGLLLATFAGTKSREAGELLSYLVSEDVTAPYGNIVGRPA
jgi:hypothetical protein